MRRGSVVCALWRRVSATSAVGHGDDVRAVVERLVEVADAACDIGVTGEGEGDDGNPAKRKPRIALDDIGRHVPTVVALADHALVALDFLAERVLAAHEEEEHGGRRPGGRRLEVGSRSGQNERGPEAGEAQQQPLGSEMETVGRGAGAGGIEARARGQRPNVDGGLRWGDEW